MNQFVFHGNCTLTVQGVVNFFSRNSTINHSSFFLLEKYPVSAGKQRLCVVNSSRIVTSVWPWLPLWTLVTLLGYVFLLFFRCSWWKIVVWLHLISQFYFFFREMAILVSFINLVWIMSGVVQCWEPWETAKNWTLKCIKAGDWSLDKMYMHTLWPVWTELSQCI